MEGVELERVMKVFGKFAEKRTAREMEKQIRRNLEKKIKDENLIKETAMKSAKEVGKIEVDRVMIVDDEAQKRDLVNYFLSSEFASEKDKYTIFLVPAQAILIDRGIENIKNIKIDGIIRIEERIEESVGKEVADVFVFIPEKSNRCKYKRMKKELKTLPARCREGSVISAADEIKIKNL